MKLIPQHEKAFETIMSGQNCFVTGGGGVGKTHILRTIVHAFEHKGKQVIVAAPTGAAAVLVQGATIHRSFGIPSGACINEKSMKIMVRTTDALRKADVVIIDEVSMCRMDLFDSVCASLQKAEEKSGIHKQLIVFGDFYQLPPVLTETHGERNLLEKYYGKKVGNAYAFQGEYWDKMNFVPIILTDVIRQADRKTIENLNMARVGNPECIRYFNRQSAPAQFLKGIYLSGKKEDVDKWNTEELNKLPGEPKTYDVDITGVVEKQDLVVQGSITLKEGALITTITNHPDGYYVNGSIGTVTGLKEGYILVKFPKLLYPIIVKNYKWDVYDYSVDDQNVIHKTVIGSYTQLPVRLAYASTIHKAQGATYDEMNLNPRCWSPGQLYVALSRMRNIHTIYLLQDIRPSDLIADPTVTQFYESLNTSTANIKKQVGRPPNLTGSTVVKRIPAELADDIEKAVNMWLSMGSNRYNYAVHLIPRGMEDKLDLFVEKQTDGTGRIEYVNDPNDPDSYKNDVPRDS